MSIRITAKKLLLSFQIKQTDSVPREVRALYESAFPLYERRLWDQQLMLLKSGELKLLIIESEGEFSGFVFYWTLKDFVFVEHFALLESLRGKGGGSAVMNGLKEMFPLIVLEVEPADHNADALRRIAFYKRLGYLEFAAAYLQPPYHVEEVYRPMMLMYDSEKNRLPSYETVKEELYRTVYGIR